MTIPIKKFTGKSGEGKFSDFLMALNDTRSDAEQRRIALELLALDPEALDFDDMIALQSDFIREDLKNCLPSLQETHQAKKAAQFYRDTIKHACAESSLKLRQLCLPEVQGWPTHQEVIEGLFTEELLASHELISNNPDVENLEDLFLNILASTETLRGEVDGLANKIAQLTRQKEAVELEKTQLFVLIQEGARALAADSDSDDESVVSLQLPSVASTSSSAERASTPPPTAGASDLPAKKEKSPGKIQASPQKAAQQASTLFAFQQVIEREAAIQARTLEEQRRRDNLLTAQSGF